MLPCPKCRFNNPGGCTLYPEGTAEVQRMNYCHYFDEVPPFESAEPYTITLDERAGRTRELGLNDQNVVDCRNYPQLQQQEEEVDVEQLHDSVVKLERLLREVMESRKGDRRGQN